jgi:sugar lactone lactonase YvrE
MPCFGGNDLRTLYLSSARHHRSAAELRAFPQVGLRVVAAGRGTGSAGVNFYAD